jgi:hypothetical protein
MLKTHHLLLASDSHRLRIRAGWFLLIPALQQVQRVLMRKGTINRMPNGHRSMKSSMTDPAGHLPLEVHLAAALAGTGRRALVIQQRMRGRELSGKA